MTDQTPFRVGDKVRNRKGKAWVVESQGDVDLLNSSASKYHTLVARAHYAPPEMTDGVVVSRAALERELVVAYSEFRAVSHAEPMADAALQRLTGGA